LKFKNDSLDLNIDSNALLPAYGEDRPDIALTVLVALFVAVLAIFLAEEAVFLTAFFLVEEAFFTAAFLGASAELFAATGLDNRPDGFREEDELLERPVEEGVTDGLDAIDPAGIVLIVSTIISIPYRVKVFAKTNSKNCAI
jgi:hypothetical protein